jgi:hypothetical protein
LGKFGESVAVAVISALTDPTASVRSHAIAVLDNTDGKMPIVQLEEMAKAEHDGSVRWAAERRLKK